MDGGVNGLAIKVSNGKKKLRFKVYVWNGNEDELSRFAEIVKSDGNLENLAALTKGGPRRWVEDLETQGKLGEGKGPYVIDTLTPQRTMEVYSSLVDMISLNGDVAQSVRGGRCLVG